MNNSLVNGYLLVLANEEEGYAGVDRDPWSPIEDHYYARTLPEQLRVTFEVIKLDQTGHLWWPTCRDIGTAATFQEFAERAGFKTEVIGIYSKYLAESETRRGWEEPRAVVRGVDVVSVGEWSLLRAMLDVSTPIREEILKLVNDAGLLPDSTRVNAVEARYRELARVGMVEAIADVGAGLGVEPVRVFTLDE